ncbi:peptidyl-prolyl cis-trans isomerase pin1 [Jimgerdemannia flammicorona]|uniref:Peptidyl-prolyl cis-trans isomerase n=1 Tax=Jimgerdemannia flammicorona TaxID=994334 RepID=A0A433QID3_9FUNG|nr:peptidyl-prolyl cis-trans isomerase pin1 [Jimgerdemannia flammicorona]
MELPQNWEVRHSRTYSKDYYFNTLTKESRWDPPPMGENERIRASHLLIKHKDSRRPSSWKEGRSFERNYFWVGNSEKGEVEDLRNEPNEPSPAISLLSPHMLTPHLFSLSLPQEKILRTKEEALEILKRHQKRIETGETTLSAAATTESDCSSARRGGDLGHFERGQMQKPFEDAAFALEVGQLSEPVFTDSGVHLILRTA